MKNFGKWNFLALILKDFLYFLKRKLCYISENGNSEKIPYILGNGTFFYFRKLQEVTFRARKMKKAHCEKMSYISGNGIF